MRRSNRLHCHVDGPNCNGMPLQTLAFAAGANERKPKRCPDVEWGGMAVAAKDSEVEAMEHQQEAERLQRRRSTIKFLVVMALLVVATGFYALRFDWPGRPMGGEHLRALTTEDFDEAAASGVVLVDFWSPRCGPCRQQLPILEQVAQRVEGRASVMKVNIDEQGDLAGRFNVQAIPTLILLHDGRPVERFVGVTSADELVDAIDTAAAEAVE